MKPVVDRWERLMLDRSPLGAYARLHWVVPRAAVFLALMLVIGTMLPANRDGEEARYLIARGPARDSYLELVRDVQNLDKKLVALGDRDYPLRLGPPEIERRERRDAARQRAYIQRRELLRQKMQALAEARGLQNCWREYVGVFCDGRRLEERSFVTFFWIGIAVSITTFVGWLYLQLRDCWMLPRSHSRLWYTPVYAATVVSIFAAPFLMIAWYFQRANWGQPSHVDWQVGQPGLPLLLTATLQLSIVVIATVDARPSSRLLSALGWIVVSGLSLFAVFSLSSGALTVLLLVLVAILIIFAVLSTAKRELQPGAPRDARYFVFRVARLTRGLLPAWVLLGGKLFLHIFGVHRTGLDAALAVAVVFACTLYVVRSHRLELQPDGS